MSSVLFRRSSQMVMATVIVFMFLNAFLPLDFMLQSTEYPLKLKTTLEKTMFRLGEPVNVTSTLTNIGNENFTLPFIDYPLDFLIRDINFNRVFRYHSNLLWPRIVPAVPITIELGDSMTTTSIWEQVYDDSYTQVPSGTYYVAGIFRYGVRIETPVIRITILGV